MFEALVFPAILVAFDFINWIYVWLGRRLGQQNVKLFGPSFFRGYWVIGVGCAIIGLAISASTPFGDADTRNVVAGSIFLAEVAYIFFVRPRLLLAESD